MAQGKTCYFLTLTSAPGTGRNLAHDWDLLVKRVRREMGFKFEYMKVETSEGNGVIHALFHSAFTEKDGLTVELYNQESKQFEKTGKYFDAIHAYFSCLWKELHNSPVVWCSVVDHTTVYLKKQKRWITLTKKRVARYIVQYTVNQKGFLRRAQSVYWIFKSWRKKFLKFIQDHGFQEGIKRWRYAISNPDFEPNPKEAIQFPIGL